MSDRFEELPEELARQLAAAARAGLLDSDTEPLRHALAEFVRRQRQQAAAERHADCRHGVLPRP